VHVCDARNADMILVWKTECSDLAYHMTCKVWFCDKGYYVSFALDSAEGE
jgi:hypothetical protein